jgi:hypothetical protein
VLSVFACRVAASWAVAAVLLAAVAGRAAASASIDDWRPRCSVAVLPLCMELHAARTLDFSAGTRRLSAGRGVLGRRLSSAVYRVQPFHRAYVRGIFSFLFFISPLFFFF